MAKKQVAAVKSPMADGPRERIKRYLVQRFYTRFHMSLILMSAGFAAMLSNWAMLHWGVGKMWIRYPIAITLSYLTFLAGVWLWIKYVEFRRDGSDSKSKSSLADGLDLPNVSIPSGGGGGAPSGIANVLRSGGGGFDGGGAAGAWEDVVPVQALAGTASPSVPAPSGGFADAVKDISGKFGDFGDLDGDAAIIIVLALVLVGAVVILSGYLIWFAPDILSEAIFGATLAGGLARAAKRQDNEDWVMGVVKKTCWPFIIVFVLSMFFAIFAASHYPGARTFGEAMQMAIAG